ncbi:hypothetical protein [Priestia megaterium]|uniref:hypothetical protein n=1 Tax=Priestia megaterium TaxID=1404 RepID=UPI0027961459|nr:hypothetical protein [Priestia megaterium]
MPITNKDLKKSKDLVEKLLKVNGEKYNDWLHAQHQEYIENNQHLILEALSAFVGDDSSSKDNEKESKEESSESTVNTSSMENSSTFKQTV